jgi:DNA helicase HerA-like ATPase
MKIILRIFFHINLHCYTFVATCKDSENLPCLLTKRLQVPILEIKSIKSGKVFVIDIGTISSLAEQSFVVGDVMKSIDEMYSTSDGLGNDDENSNRSKSKKKRPKYILIFIDEINRFVPKSHNVLRMNPVSEQIMRTVIAGGARQTILFSVQQFKSGTDYRLQENTVTYNS